VKYKNKRGVRGWTEDKTIFFISYETSMVWLPCVLHLVKNHQNGHNERSLNFGDDGLSTTKILTHDLIRGLLLL